MAGGDGDLAAWATTTGGMLLLLLAGLAAGSWLCGWALRRSGDAGSGRRTGTVRRRGPRSSALRELVAVDRASVWRAPALRRGGLVLAVLPGLVAAGAALPWASLVILPGLVAAGAGLLFGVNAFSLDASGATWLASLPHDPRLVLRAKAVVLTETVLAAVVVAAAVGSLRSPGSPTGVELCAIVVSGLVCTLAVVTVALAASVRRPHRADLRGPRDAVAPPGALAIASVRLAVPTTLVGILLGSSLAFGAWWAPVVFAVPPVLLCALSLRRTVRWYADPVTRARIVSVVSAG